MAKTACAIRIKYVCSMYSERTIRVQLNWTELKSDELRVTQTLVPTTTMPSSYPTVLGQGINGMKGQCNRNRFSFCKGEYLSISSLHPKL